MNIFRKVYVRIFPKVYIRRSIGGIERKFREKRHQAIDLPQLEQWNLEAEFHHELGEWLDWQRSIEDKDQVKRAKKMDILLDDIPIPPPDEDDYRSSGHYYFGNSGDKLLQHDVRKAFETKIRERKPSYDKE